MCTAASNTPTITVESGQTKPREEIVLSVRMDNNPGINTFALGFEYDKKVLELVDVSVNEELGGQFVFVKKAVWFNSKDVTFNGEILTLRFKVTQSAQNGNTQVKVTYSAGDISDYNENDVNFSCVAGNVEITSDNEQEYTLWEKIKNFFKDIYEFIKRMLGL